MLETPFWGKCKSNDGWEGMKERVMQCGTVEKSRREKEERAHILSTRVWKGIEAHRWKGSRTVWTVGKIGIVKYAWIYVSTPVMSVMGEVEGQSFRMMRMNA